MTCSFIFLVFLDLLGALELSLEGKYTITADAFMLNVLVLEARVQHVVFQRHQTRMVLGTHWNTLHSLKVANNTWSRIEAEGWSESCVVLMRVIRS